MKIREVLFVLLLPVLAFGQEDESAIRSAVEDYLQGGTNGNVEQFKNAFVPSAIQRSIGKDGDVIGMTVEKLSSKIKPGNKMNRETRIESISYAGIAATAITETIYPNSKIVDMLNLLKIDNDWKIVSRVYSRIDADENIQSTAGQGMANSPKVSAFKDTKTQTPKPAPKKKDTVTWDDEW